MAAAAGGEGASAEKGRAGQESDSARDPFDLARETMQRIYDERRKGSEQQVVQSAGEADNVFIAHSGTGAITIPPSTGWRSSRSSTSTSCTTR